MITQIHLLHKKEPGKMRGKTCRRVSFFLTTGASGAIMATANGLVAQLGAHHIRIVGVGSSNLLKSTNKKVAPMGRLFYWYGICAEEIRRPKMGYAGGISLSPVQTLVATLINEVLTHPMKTSDAFASEVFNDIRSLWNGRYIFDMISLFER